MKTFVEVLKLVILCVVLGVIFGAVFFHLDPTMKNTGHAVFNEIGNNVSEAFWWFFMR